MQVCRLGFALAAGIMYSHPDESGNGRSDYERVDQERNVRDREKRCSQHIWLQVEEAWPVPLNKFA